MTPEQWTNIGNCAARRLGRLLAFDCPYQPDREEGEALTIALALEMAERARR